MPPRAIPALSLPHPHDICPVQARVLALEGRVDVVTDRLDQQDAMVRELSAELKVTVDRNRALNVEMGTQLQRYAEYTERNCKQDERSLALEQRLTELIETLREQVKQNGGRGKAKNHV